MKKIYRVSSGDTERTIAADTSEKAVKKFVSQITDLGLIVECNGPEGEIFFVTENVVEQKKEKI